MRIRADLVLPSGGRAPMAGKIQSKKGMLSFEECHLPIPDLSISACSVDQKERGVFFLSRRRRFQDLKGRSVEVKNHGR